jgi:hypothetical protein
MTGKTSRLCVIGIVLACVYILIISGSADRPAFGKQKAMDIFDYYCALPDAYFQCEFSAPVPKEARIKQITKKNVKNGFIAAKSEGFPMQVALFTDSRMMLNIIAVNITCGAGCMCNKFALLSYSTGGTWHEVTADIFPHNKELIKAIKAKTGTDDVLFEFVLPEFGTAIRVVEISTKKHLIDINWTDGKLFIK